MRTFTLNCSLDFAAITSDSNQRLSVLFIPDTLPPVLVYAGQEWRGLSFGIVSGEGVYPDGVFVRYGGIPAEVREY